MVCLPSILIRINHSDNFIVLSELQQQNAINPANKMFENGHITVQVIFFLIVNSSGVSKCVIEKLTGEQRGRNRFCLGAKKWPV